MYAIIATGGKQYRVAEGDSIKIERIDAEVGSAVTFDQVLAVNNGELTIGCPTVEGATVSATVEKVGKGKKVIVYTRCSQFPIPKEPRNHPCRVHT